MADAIPLEAPAADAGRFTLVSASAGSGKTYKLVHAFVRALHGAVLAGGDGGGDPAVVDRVLAATFTRAAAAEIVDRILRRLAEAVADPAERATLCGELGCGGLSAGDCERMLAAVLRRLHRFRVGTVDSFLVAAARAFAPELGLADGWAVLDEAAEAELQVAAVDAMLGRLAAAGPEEFAATCDLLVAAGRGRAKTDLRRGLADRLAKAEPALWAGPPAAWAAIQPATPPLAAGRVAELLAQLGTLMPLTRAGTPNSLWFKAVGAIAPRLAEGDWAGLAKDGLLGKVINGENSYGPVPFSPAHLAVLRPLADHVRAGLVAEIAARNAATRELLVRFDAAYAAARGRAGAVRFDDVGRLLDDRRVMVDLPELLYRLGGDGRIDHVLLDEFQDTSARQWRLLRPIVAALFDGGGAGRSFFCVGDVKQSLYAWRNAEPELMETLPASWPSLAQLPLAASYRSAPQVIQAVNAAFAGLVGNPAVTGRPPLAEAAAAFAVWFHPHGTERTHAGYCRLITCPATEDAADPDGVALACVADRAAALHRDHPAATVAVLARRRKCIPALLDLLRRRGVTATGEGGSPLADDAAVCAVLSLLHLAGHPGDSAARFHVAHSPLGPAVGLPPGPDPAADWAALAAVRLAAADDGLAVTIDCWRRRIAGDCDDRNASRLAQLVELAHEFDAADVPPDLDRFAAAVRVRRVEDRRPAPVKVMTVHASKGREFDFVVLADLDRDLTGDVPPVLVRRPDVLADADCITVAPGKDAAKVDGRLAAIDAAARRKQAVEELCGLYVAMTRAKTGLEMVCQPEPLSRTGQLPASAGGLLRGALLGVTVVEPDAELWRVGERPPADAARPAPPPAADPLRPVVDPAGPASRVRPAVAPSSLEGDGWARLGAAPSESGLDGRGVGTVLHRWFEQIEWLDDHTPDDAALVRVAADLAVPTDRLPGLLRQFRLACDRPPIAALLTRGGRGGLRVWRERPFAVRIALAPGQPATLTRGFFDRLVVSADAAELIDFKTDAAADDAAVNRLVAHYAPQVRAYRAAAARLLRLPADRVSAKLAFVGHGRVVTVD